jgi:hypothetical protein
LDLSSTYESPSSWLPNHHPSCSSVYSVFSFTFCSGGWTPAPFKAWDVPWVLLFWMPAYVLIALHPQLLQLVFA